MNRCPKCGYEEPVHWLPSTWDVENEVAPYTDFQMAYSHILCPGGMTEINDYTYRRSKDGRYAIRILTSVLKARGGRWRIPRKDWDSLKRSKRLEALLV
jgi:hypothetical protein